MTTISEVAHAMSFMTQEEKELYLRNKDERLKMINEGGLLDEIMQSYELEEELIIEALARGYLEEFAREA